MSIKTSVLENGLTVVTETMPRFESVAMGAWVKAGSRDELTNQHGIAHLLEHMAFKGTKARSAREIVEQVENVGGDVNAATGLETTSYFARMLKQDAALGMEILHDILENSTLDEHELQREKHVILQEIGAAHDSPEDVVFDHYQTAAFGKQALGRAIMGTPDSVEGFAKNDLRGFMDAHYHGPNMVLSCAGGLEHEEVLAMAKDGFSKFSAQAVKECETASYIGGVEVEQRDLMEAQIMLGFEGRAYHVRDFYASQLLASILGGGMSSRLFQQVREKHGLCYSIYAFHWGFSDTGSLGIHAATSEEDVSDLLDVVTDELKTATQNISEEEVDRARAQIRSHLVMSNESAPARSAQNARQILLFGRLISPEELMQRLDAISAERLQELAANLISGSKPSIAAVGPVSKLPTMREVTSKLAIA